VKEKESRRKTRGEGIGKNKTLTCEEQLKSKEKKERLLERKKDYPGIEF